MSIIAAELKLYKSNMVTDTPSNGGIMSNNEIIGGVKNNIFPDVSQADRISGIIRHRKIFAKVANDVDEVLMNPVLHLKQFTPGEDRVEIFQGTQTDTESDIVGNERKYGSGGLSADVAAGDTSLILVMEDISQVIANTGAADNKIYITDGTNEEYHSNCSVSIVGLNVTITLEAGDQLFSNYTSASSFVSTVLNDTQISTMVDGVTVTSGAGTFDNAGYPIEGDNISTVEDVFTCTFTSATGFDVTGATSGSVGSGTTTADFFPANNNQSNKPYFLIRSAAWGGTFVAGDTLIFSTHPAAMPIWLKQTVPAGTNSYSGNNFDIRFGGESS